ncbi:MAG TPA: penicillin acylase family protein, partial [Candidatus Baltobacteraceae bacterium]|nr:penicillin acylase family protein [Candidatus Baltobacteraceae bacterium]
MKRALRRIGLGLVALISLPLLVLAAYALYVVAGVWAGAGAMTGTLSGLGVRAPVRIARDARGIPHVRAGNERDLFFAEGYLQGSERLFQLDVYRRLVAGRLAEVFGSAALESDVEARVVDVAGIIRDQERSLDPRERDDVQAFADGVNAAMRTRPLPPEFRVLAYQPEPWTREDSLRASFATVLTLTDSWNDVLVRADVADALGSSALDAFFPITDPRYDSPTTTRVPAPVAKLP